MALRSCSKSCGASASSRACAVVLKAYELKTDSKFLFIRADGKLYIDIKCILFLYLLFIYSIHYRLINYLNPS